MKKKNCDPLIFKPRPQNILKRNFMLLKCVKKDSSHNSDRISIVIMICWILSHVFEQLDTFTLFF